MGAFVMQEWLGAWGLGTEGREGASVLASPALQGACMCVCVCGACAEILGDGHGGAADTQSSHRSTLEALLCA